MIGRKKEGNGHGMGKLWVLALPDNARHDRQP
jgi:hypothetical protein